MVMATTTRVTNRLLAAKRRKDSSAITRLKWLSVRVLGNRVRSRVNTSDLGLSAVVTIQ